MFRQYAPIVLLAVVLLAVFTCTGCPSPTPTPGTGTTPTTSSSAAPLKVLVVDDAPLGEAIARQWRSRTEGTLEIQSVTRQELLKASRLPGDVVIAAAGDVGSLVERELVVPLDDAGLAGTEFDRRDIFDQVRLRDIAWGNRTVAVPLGSPQFLLAYRPELLEKHGIAPPTTWAEYQGAIDKLVQAAGADKPSLVAAEPTAEGWAGLLLLARAAAYVTHRDQVSPLFDYATLDPLITTAPYERALTELVAARKEVAADRQLTPDQALAELEADNAAMAITWPSPTRKTAESGGVKIEFRPLPGSADAFNFARMKWEPRRESEERHVPLLAVSGRIAAVTSTASDPQAAQSLIVWMSGREVSPLVGPASSATTLFRESQLASPGPWTGSMSAESARSYVAALKSSASLQRYVSLRLPGREEYLAALDEAVHAAIAGEKPPAEALAAASEQWKAITATRGIEAQRRALARDLGLESLP
jgi:ABC-type glycerol-3-phosphate transport system substrate-binding protein